MTGERVECIALICFRFQILEAEKIEHLERRQEKLIREYAKKHGIRIVDVVYCRGLGQFCVNQKFNDIVAMIQKGRVQGLIVNDMKTISAGLADAYGKVGKVRSAGGEMITVNEGSLKLNIRSKFYGK